MHLQSFPKAERLLKRHEFIRLGGRGRKIHSVNFIIVRGESGAPLTRLGITVSRKVGIAVARNRCKRLIREFYRQNKSLFISADYNIIAKPGAARLEYLELVGELTEAVQHLG